jgi:tRNA1Val (adenine37-N6)-methyltransferase
MANPFRFKQFNIVQEANPQKIGSDSMLLGAWTKGEYKRILDIGTGTGILALMMAQSHPNGNVTAIEPQASSYEEAVQNFKASPFSDRILAIQSRLQQFGSMDKFDLIICNPPYFSNSFLSEDNGRNSARHTIDLRVDELYEYGAELLSETGNMNVILPFESETEHIERAFDNNLFIKKILHTQKVNGTKIRSLISFSFEDVEPEISSLLVKDSKNKYSDEYIQLTKEFYFKDL